MYSYLNYERNQYLPIQWCMALCRFTSCLEIIQTTHFCPREYHTELPVVLKPIYTFNKYLFCFFSTTSKQIIKFKGAKYNDYFETVLILRNVTKCTCTTDTLMEADFLLLRLTTYQEIQNSGHWAVHWRTSGHVNPPYT